MSEPVAPARPKSFRESLAALPVWARVVLSLVFAHLGCAAVVVALTAVATLLPWVLMLGAVLVDMAMR